MKINLKYLGMALATGAIVSVAAPSANAVLIVHLDDNAGNTATVVDGDGDGFVVFNGALGVWIVNVSTGQSKPILGSDEFPKMDLSSVNTSTGLGVKTLTITLSDAFTTPQAGGMTSLIGGVTQGIVSAVGSTSTGGAFVNHGPLGPGAFADTTSGAIPDGPYTLIMEANITHGGDEGRQVSSFNWMVCAVPDAVPDGGASITLLGLSLLGLAGVRRKLLRKAG